MKLQSDPDPSRKYGLPSLADVGTLVRLAAIGVMALVFVVAFAAAAGWLSPARLTQDKMMDAFTDANGPHPGFRRNHAKGVCGTGTFQSNGKGERLSSAAEFKSGEMPVVGRFAFAGGQPFVADGSGIVRSLALSFRPPHGEEWRTGMLDIPVFPVRDPEAFYEQMVASLPDPATGKPNPEKMEAFRAAHPETVRAFGIIGKHPFSSDFANETYNALNAFRFVNAAGAVTPVRWSVVPEAPPAPPDRPADQDKNYLFDALVAAVHQGPLRWHLILTVGQPGDPTGDATLPWPDDREHVDVGTVTIDHIEAEAPGNCRDVNYDPLVLPAGIKPSDDPLLSARSAAYSESFRLRAGEPKTPSAVQIGAEGGK
ncbi:MAG TPA: catalase family peroxidase [Alphaproteobacteria bacterium]|jgi:catalase|nr:catalase family peroxidase [Alphaproteobacteria bacterium]